MDKYLKLIEAAQMKKDVPAFGVGDTVDVQVKIVEEGKTRLQSFEGIVIARRGSGLRETFTVRKISYGEGVERIFPLHSPSVDRITLVKKGDVNRAKLYYLKKKVGKETKVEEKIGEHASEIPAEEKPQAENISKDEGAGPAAPREEAK
jgi:large subunit ribosomal protein L19